MSFVRVASLAAVLLAASCGGDEGDPLSADEFRDRAEANCREIEETDVRPPSDVNDMSRYADEFIAAFEASVNDTQELEPPEEFQDRWQEYLVLLDDAESELHEFRDDLEGATRGGDRDTQPRPKCRLRGTQKKRHAIERELGLDECID